MLILLPPTTTTREEEGRDDVQGADREDEDRYAFEYEDGDQGGDDRDVGGGGRGRSVRAGEVVEEERRSGGRSSIYSSSWFRRQCEFGQFNAGACGLFRRNDQEWRVESEGVGWERRSGGAGGWERGREGSGRGVVERGREVVGDTGGGEEPCEGGGERESVVEGDAVAGEEKCERKSRRVEVPSLPSSSTNVFVRASFGSSILLASIIR